MILVLAGTVDGRKMSGLIRKRGWPVITSVVSEYGAQLLYADGLEHVKTGALTMEQLLQVLKDHKIDILIDATHPYAQSISATAMEAAAALSVEYIRLERGGGWIPSDNLVHNVGCLEEIKEYLSPDQKVFSTLGSKNLATLAFLVREAGAELIVRVLPRSEVIKQCEMLGLSPEQIIAIKGPFSREMNRCLFSDYQADLLLTKDSGSEGGFEAKLTAALELNIPVLIWSRPSVEYPLVFNSPEEIIEHIAIHWKP